MSTREDTSSLYSSVGTGGGVSLPDDVTENPGARVNQAVTHETSLGILIASLLMLLLAYRYVI